jgi:AcrR family transcriptional regulator
MSSVVGLPVRVAPSTKEQIVLAAERLFGEQGLDNVSLRQIGAAAGAAHNSAVQYHFGTKDQLVRAIFEYRMPGIDARRRLRIAERQPDDLRSWLECAVLPILEQAEQPNSHYQTFVSMLQHHGRADILLHLPGDGDQSIDRVFQELAARLPHVPEPLRSHRLTRALAFAVAVGADRERAHDDGGPLLPYALHATDLVDALAAFLAAPVSDAAQAALRDIDPSLVRTPPPV